MENKKVMIPVILGVMLLCGIVFTLVYKKTDGNVNKEPPVVQTLAPKETEPIETRVAGENTLKDFEVNETKKLPKSIIVDNSGEVLSEEEAKEYEKSIADSMKLETITKEDGSEVIVDVNGNEIGVEADNSEQAQETMSGQVMEEIQEGINDYTYKQSYEELREFIKLQVQLQKENGNSDFANITEEYIDNASYDELDTLYIKILEVAGSGR